MFLPRKVLEKRLLELVTEDTGQGDITTSLIIPAETIVEARIMAKETGIVAGMEEAQLLLEIFDLKPEALVSDGDKIRPKQVLMKTVGDARTILSVERTLLNLLSRMSGIATATNNLMERLRRAQAKTKVACTRKTAPGLLYFDKKAVSIGGGDTHRLHLDDMILIKDNHIVVVGNVVKAVRRAKNGSSFSKKIEVEITKIEDVLPAIQAGADIIMFDNFSPAQVENAVTLLKKRKVYGKVLLEASGAITSLNILKYASAGIDIVSLGEITQSVRALDISLEISVKKE